MKAVLIGLVTLHLLLHQVADLRGIELPSDSIPIAVADCSELGHPYAVIYAGQAYRGIVVDCLAPEDIAGHEAFWKGRWIGELPLDVWQGPEVPQSATLWPLPPHRSEPTP